MAMPAGSVKTMEMDEGGMDEGEVNEQGGEQGDGPNAARECRLGPFQGLLGPGAPEGAFPERPQEKLAAD
jgi:hypothetical protein